jgi:hypothetical protein
MKKVILAAAIAAALTGCGTTSLVEKKADWVQGSDKVDLAMAPEWFTMHLANDDSHIFATATEYSADYQFAIDRAMMAAKINLAGQINQRVESEMNSFISESGTGGDIDDVERSVERKSRAVIDTTMLVGYKRDKIEVRREGKGYRVYVRLVYDYTDNNKLVQQAVKAEKRKAKAAEKAQGDNVRSLNIPKPDTKPSEDKTVSQRADELPHNTISNQAVKKQVEDAIARGDAVIMTQTVR